MQKKKRENPQTMKSRWLDCFVKDIPSWARGAGEGNVFIPNEVQPAYLAKCVCVWGMYLLLKIKIGVNKNRVYKDEWSF